MMELFKLSIFPMQVGMSLWSGCMLIIVWGFPHASGDWPPEIGVSVGLVVVFPTQAGIDQAVWAKPPLAYIFSRISGDRPCPQGTNCGRQFWCGVFMCHRTRTRTTAPEPAPAKKVCTNAIV